MLVPFLRTMILYLIVIAAIRLMGKRQVGEMQPTELVITILVSAVASVPMQDIDIPLLHGIVPILALIGAEVIVSAVSLKSLRFRRLLTGKPVLIVEDGKVDQEALKKLRLSLDDVFEDLRLKDVFDLRDIKMAQVETSGQISVLLNSKSQTVTAKMMSLSPSPQEPLQMIVADGYLIRENLAAIGQSEQWLHSVLAANGAKTLSDVFFLLGDKTGGTVYAGKEQ